MQTLSLVGPNGAMPNVTITMYSDEEDHERITSGATNDDGTFDEKRADRIEFARTKRRLARQGATETNFFPVEPV